MMNSSLIYIGDVSIKVSKKSYRYKNSGTPLLFDIFCRWLAGESNEILNDIKPKYLRIRNLNDATNYISIEDIPITKSFKTTAKGPATIVTGAILDTNIQTGDSGYNSQSSYILELCNPNRQALAQISLNSDVLNQVIAGRQALVEWSLRISNRGDE